MVLRADTLFYLKKIYGIFKEKRDKEGRKMELKDALDFLDREGLSESWDWPVLSDPGEKSERGQILSQL